jgi:alpha-methylacyl-CoA racemase
LTNVFHGLLAGGIWTDPPGTNVLDSGAHFYEVYETADGGHVAVGALEPQFYAKLLELLGIDPAEMPQWDRDRWPSFKERFTEIFKRRTRDEWAALLEPADACATPVLGLTEAPEHPHMRARGTFVTIDGVLQPGPAPRFSRTPGEVVERDPADALAAWGLDESAISAADPQAA